MLHALVRHRSSRARWTVGVATVVAIIGVASIPAVAQKASQSELLSLQQSQNKNAALHSKLALEGVNFRTPGDVAVNLPRRMFDLIFRPYPWQVADWSQRLGVIETLFVLALVVLLARAILKRGRTVLATTGPLLYQAVALWIAYSLAVTNAGTGFRYRTQIIPLMIGIVFALRADARTSISSRADNRPHTLVATEA
jgi:hypothetical protein